METNINIPKHVESFELEERRRLAKANKEDNNNSWRLYRQSDHIRPSAQEIYDKATKVAKLSLRMAALYALGYLGAMRGQEITRYYKKVNGVLTQKYSSITIGQLNIVTLNGHEYFKISNRVLKLREDRVENYAQHKIIPWTKHDVPIYGLIGIVDSYIESLPAQTPQTELFPFSYNYGLQNLIKYFGVTFHCLRRWRCKSLIEDYNLSPEDLKVWVRWKTDQMAMHYSQSSQQAITNRFEREVIFEDEEDIHVTDK